MDANDDDARVQRLFDAVFAYGVNCVEQERAKERDWGDLEGTCIVQMRSEHPAVLWWAARHEDSKAIHPPEVCGDNIRLQEAWCKGVVAALAHLAVPAFPRCRVG